MIISLYLSVYLILNRNLHVTDMRVPIFSDTARSNIFFSAFISLESSTRLLPPSSQFSLSHKISFFPLFPDGLFHLHSLSSVASFSPLNPLSPPLLRPHRRLLRSILNPPLVVAKDCHCSDPIGVYSDLSSTLLSLRPRFTALIPIVVAPTLLPLFSLSLTS